MDQKKGTVYFVKPVVDGSIWTAKKRCLSHVKPWTFALLSHVLMGEHVPMMRITIDATVYLGILVNTVKMNTMNVCPILVLAILSVWMV